MFAQTGLNSTPSSTDLPSSTPASSVLWWLIPLALAIAGIAWYFRRQWNLPSQPSTTKTVPRAKETGIVAIDASLAESFEAAIATNNRKNIQPRKAGKKSKKDRSVVERQIKSLVDQQTPPSDSKSVSLADLPPSLPLSNPPPTKAPVTTTAIFEPLRDVGPKRSRAIFSTQLDSLRPTDEVAPSQPSSGGKFERTVATNAATRSAANRWPASATQPIRSNAVAPQRPQASSLPPDTQVSTPAPISAPAKGLSSFVSKVRSSVATDLVPSPVNVEPASKE